MVNLWETISGGFGQVAEFIGKGAAEVIKFGVKTNPKATVQAVKTAEETAKPVVEPIKETVETVQDAGKTIIDGANNIFNGVKTWLPVVGAGAVALLLLSRR